MPKAYVFTELGGPEAESFADLPRPVPAPGQVLVEVRAAGVNPVDWKRRAGFRPVGTPVPDLPAVFGNEAAGVVVEVGPDSGDGDTARFAVGDEVFGNTVAGGYAEYALLLASVTAHKPAALSWADAASLPVASATAYDAVRQLALPPDGTLLINGAGGGVGVAAVQIARHDGLTVLGTASAAKKEFLESLGAVHVTSGLGVADRVRAAAPGGVDGIVDLVGGEPLRDVAALLADPAELVSAGDRGTVAELGGSPVVRKRTAQVLDDLAGLVVGGDLDPLVTRTFPFAQAGEALRAVEGGHARGKIVIEFDA
ncbi:NADP-dependent oxidoreductase [Streptomyces sp. NBC_00448]|uniref:NADP-dependent oxidoreductase n=1 Tax=Streptomyces sp. NBC_00448 TaxID=2903652 RepID=UPI002E1D5E97